MPNPTPSHCAGWLTIAATILAVAGGGLTLLFTFKAGQCFSTLVALAMAVFWGAVAVMLVVSASSARRVQAEMREDTVNRVLEYLSDLDPADAEERAELVDRMHVLATTALGKP